jgi:hypothetical protein
MKKIGGPKAQEFPAFTATAGAAIVNEFDTYYLSGPSVFLCALYTFNLLLALTNARIS